MLCLTCIEKLGPLVINLRQNISHSSTQADEHVQPTGKLFPSYITKVNGGSQRQFWHVLFVKMSFS
jgi:hypothetical protein